MTQNLGDVLILGAGPAGMAAAMELTKNGVKFEIIEKTNSVGGLAKTLQFGDFKTDIGPHRFFSKNRYLYDFVEDLLGEQWIKVKRETHFYIDRKFFEYPVDVRELLNKIPHRKLLKIVLDYFQSKINYNVLRKPVDTFEDYALLNFGRTLADFNVLNYTEKVWGLLPSKLSPNWGKKRIQGLSLFTLVKNVILKTSDSKTLVDEFFYPELGAGLIYEKIKERIESKGNSIFYNTRPISIGHDGKRITNICISVTDKENIVNPDYIISSIPITELVTLFNPQAPQTVLRAASNLKWRSQVYLFLTINKEYVTRDNWTYFPEKHIPFGRIYEPKNFSKKMSPPKKTSLLVEFFCWQDDDIFNATKEKLLDITLEHMEKLGLLTRGDVIDSFTWKLRYVYPVYDIGYEKNLDKIKEFLDGFENLEYIGRPGRFVYTNQDHSLEMGIMAARGVIEQKKYNIDEVDAKQEYFEKGNIPTLSLKT